MPIWMSLYARAFVLLWFVLMVYHYDAVFGTHIDAHAASALFGLILFLHVAQVPMLHKSLAHYQYPLPQIIHIVSAVEFTVLAAMPNLEVAVLSAYLFMMVWVVMTLFEEQDFASLRNGNWTCAAIAAQWAPVLVLAARYSRDLTLDPCLFCCILLASAHAATVRFACAPCNTMSCRLAVGIVARALVATVVVTCWLARYSFLQAQLVCLLVFASLTVVTDFRAIQAPESPLEPDLSVEQLLEQEKLFEKNRAVAAIDFCILRFAIMLVMLAEPELDAFRYVVVALLCVSHVVNPCPAGDFLMLIETVAVAFGGLPNPVLLLTPFLWILVVTVDMGAAVNAASLMSCMSVVAYLCVATNGIEAVVLLMCAGCVFTRAVTYFGCEHSGSRTACAVFAAAVIGALCTVHAHNAAYAVSIVAMMCTTLSTGFFLPLQ